MSDQQGPGAGPGGPSPHGGGPSYSQQPPPYGQQPPPYGQQPPPYGQQPPPHGPASGWLRPPSGPRRPRRGLVVLIVLVALVVVGGGSVAGVVVLGGDDDSQAENTPTEDPTTEPTTDPTTDPTTPPPSPDPTVTPGTPTGELAELEAALSRRGFRCGLSLERPILVRTCYHDPYFAYGDAYLQTVVDAQGVAKLVEIQVSESGEAKRVGAIMGKILESLRGTLLTAGDIRTIRQRPNAYTLRLSWGRGSTYRGGADYLSVTLTSRGYDVPYVGNGAIRTSAPDVLRHYKGKRYRCTVDPGFKSVDCLRRGGRETYAASALAPCVRRRSGRLVPCPGRAPSMTLFWGVDQRRITDAMMRRAVDAVFLPGSRLALGGQLPSELRPWLLEHLDGAPHVADFDGLHFSIDPDTLFTDREAEIALSITYVSPPSG